MTDTLPYRMYLLAYDDSARGPFDRRRTGFLVRAAALVELVLRGRLVETGDGVVRVAAPGPPTGDPVLDEVLREAAGSPHGWKHLIRLHRSRTLAAVEDRLATRGLLAADERGWRFAGRRLAVTDPTDVRALTDHASAVLRGGGPAAEVDVADAALVALCAAGRVPSVVPRRDSRVHRARVDDLTGRLGPLAPGLEKAVRGLHTTMIAAQGGMGGG
ncbi:GPP34 family phosphoprotein [Streptomyces sp. NPDC015171]|uniref:GOLPH3/VPS74 family protein n=1 Tax=Streptomyces sp. NPDC015171 TaxID=3364945 RepID=UPI0036F70F5F